MLPTTASLVPFRDGHKGAGVVSGRNFDNGFYRSGTGRDRLFDRGPIDDKMLVMGGTGGRVMRITAPSFIGDRTRLDGLELHPDKISHSK